MDSEQTMKILNCRIFACCRDVSILTRGRGTKFGAAFNQCITLSQMAHMRNNTQINQIVNNVSTDLKLLSFVTWQKSSQLQSNYM